MPAPPPPSTMRTLARELGCSTMTVSRALRNAPGVSAPTRARVLAAARRHGYRPDPALAVLNRYRHGRRAPAQSGRLAFLTNFATPDGWKHSVTFARYFAGVEKRAQALGYQLERFWLGDPALTGRRASQILRGRGVRGLIVGPLAQGRSTLALEWDPFSVVAVGRSLLSPALTTVSANHFQAVELAWREARRRGYRRIGLALTEGEDARTLGALRASHLLQQAQSDGDRLPVLITPDFSAPALKAWTAEHRPDLILGSEQGHYELLLKTKGFTRRATAFLHLNADPAGAEAGIDQGHDRVGEHAAALLHLKLIQRESGVPPQRDLLLIDGTWQEGRGPWRLARPAAGSRYR